MLPTLLAGLEASQAQTDTFIQFYKAHSVGLYRYALSWVKNPHQAEDIAQTAWLQCVQHAQRFFSLPEEKRLPWMVTLVKHAALTHLRTAGRTVTEDAARIRQVRRELAVGRVEEFLASMRALGYTDAETRTLLTEWDMKEEHMHE